MATQRNTFQKRQRERDRAAKQAAKRARRLEKNEEPEGEEEAEAPQPTAPRDDSKLLEELAEIHRLFEDKQIDFDTFEQRKADITELLAEG